MYNITKYHKIIQDIEIFSRILKRAVISISENLYAFQKDDQQN